MKVRRIIELERRIFIIVSMIESSHLSDFDFYGNADSSI